MNALFAGLVVFLSMENVQQLPSVKFNPLTNSLSSFQPDTQSDAADKTNQIPDSPTNNIVPIGIVPPSLPSTIMLPKITVSKTGYMGVDETKMAKIQSTKFVVTKSMSSSTSVCEKTCSINPNCDQMLFCTKKQDGVKLCATGICGLQLSGGACYSLSSDGNITLDVNLEENTCKTVGEEVDSIEDRIPKEVPAELMEVLMKTFGVLPNWAQPNPSTLTDEPAIPVECEEVPENFNLGSVVEQQSSSEEYPKIVTYTCAEGYKYLSGSTQAKCDKDGKWIMPAMICAPKECYFKFPDQNVYVGDVSQTASGITCQKWTVDEPHSKTYWRSTSESHLGEDMEEVGNKCRDSDNEAAPWCYTMDEDVRWDFCDVPACSIEEICKLPPRVSGTESVTTEVTDTHVTVTYACRDGLTRYSGDSTSVCDRTTNTWTVTSLLCASSDCFYFQRSLIQNVYDGDVNVTEHGSPCQRFDQDEPHSHSYHDIDDYPTDESFEEVGNRCRDPDSDQGPWCYTTNPSVRWEWCDIPNCFP